MTFDTYDSPAGLLSNLDKGYDVFVLGLICRIDPYSLEETKQGRRVGLRLIDDLRADPRSSEVPILINSTMVDRASDEIKEKGVPYITTPHTSDMFRKAVLDAIGSK